MEYVLQYQTLSESFIRKHQDELNWYFVFGFQDLTEDFIREFIDKIDRNNAWENLFKKQTLSDKFIEEFAHKVDWNDVSTSQKLPLTSIIKYTKYLNWNKVYYNNKNFKDYIIDSWKAKFEN
jgi:hypothetical protein